VKTGLLQKFWKLIVVGVVGLVAGVRRSFAALFRGGEERPVAVPPPAPSQAPIEPR
jgi:hypothetical protein